LDIIGIIHKNLASDIAQLNNIIITHLITKETLVEEVGKHLLEVGGKRIRPLLTILTSKMFGYSGNDNIKLASAVEFIHAATLLHDDVVDDSAMRRFKPTANVIWGSKSSILVGDFLFSQSFRLMVASNSIKSMQSLAQASAVISEGEVSQLVKLKERRLITIDEYHQIIMAKTAELFGASCEVGAIIAGQADDICIIMRDFGRYLGNIFQIIDDLFDYLGSSKQIGKNVGDDFLEGKVTLPLIFLYTKLEDAEQFKIDKMIQASERSLEEFEVVQKLMIKYEIEEQIIDYLSDIRQNANQLLQQVTLQNIYKEHLAALLEFTLTRSY